MRKHEITTTQLILKQLGYGLFLIFVIFVAFNKFSGKEDSKKENIDLNIEKTVEQTIRRPIDGIFVNSHAPTTLIAVIYDNAPEALPHESLSKAQMVWEIPVEGGRTRLMAFFETDVLDDDDIIGPIRSARPYFLALAKGYGAYIIHVGGSPEALDMISEGFIKSLNEFYKERYFWRAENRFAPHNTMTNKELLDSAIKDFNIKDSVFDSWKYSDELKKNTLTKSPSFVFGELSVAWKSAGDFYERFVHGIALNDAEGNIIKAANVVFMFSDMEVVDHELRRKIRTVGEGNAIVFVAGERIEGTWIRNSENDIIRFYNMNKEEIVFYPGTTWIEVLPSKWNIKTTISE